MYYITPAAMLTSMLIMTLGFYLYELVLIQRRTSCKQKWLLLVAIIISYLLYFLADFFRAPCSPETSMNIIAMLVVYWIMRSKVTSKEERSRIKVRVLLGFALWRTMILLGILVQFEVFKDTSEVKGIPFVLTVHLIEMLFVSFITALYFKFKISNKLDLINQKWLIRILMVYDCTFILVITLLSNVNPDTLSVTKRLNQNFLLLIILEMAIAIGVYFISRKVQKQKYEKALMKQELTNLKRYTDNLEKEQRQLRKFKHDYQNLILSLEEIVREEHSTKLPQYIEAFKNYVDQNFNESKIFLLNDFDNIKTPYLKSVVINQVFQSRERGIDVHFECHKIVPAEIGIESFDIVRLMGILLDNAREAALETEAKKINLMLYYHENHLEIQIENTTNKENMSQIEREGYTTKKNHMGFGLVNVKDIQRKYDNLLISYAMNDGWFVVKIYV